MNHGSLFSGIGGFELAAEWLGWENIFHCEWNEFGKEILKYYWPKSISYDDITKTDFTIHRGKINILTGGFPCQPYSAAGKRLGKEDDRHLWPEMLRAIREIQPEWVVGENVRGLINWNGGMVFDEVQADLEANGYEVAPFLLPACAVNAPHRRDRIWFIAHANLPGCEQSHKKMEREPSEQFNSFRFQQINTNSDSKQLQGSEFSGGVKTPKQKSIDKQLVGLLCDFREEYTSESPICSENDGISYNLDRITFSKWRSESLKAYGNAIVPQVALQIFKAIENYNQTHSK